MDDDVKLAVHLLDHMYAKKPHTAGSKKDTPLPKLTDHAYSSNNTHKNNKEQESKGKLEAGGAELAVTLKNRLSTSSPSTVSSSQPAKPPKKTTTRASKTRAHAVRPKKQQKPKPKTPAQPARRTVANRKKPPPARRKAASTPPAPARGKKSGPKPPSYGPKLTRYMAAISVRNIINSSSRSRANNNTEAEESVATRSRTSGGGKTRKTVSNAAQPAAPKKAMPRKRKR